MGYPHSDAQCTKRHSIKSFTKTKSVLSRIKDNTCKISLGKVIGKPLQMFEIFRSKRRTRLYLDSQHGTVIAFHHKINLSLIGIPIMTDFIIPIAICKRNKILVNPTLYYLAASIVIHVY